MAKQQNALKSGIFIVVTIGLIIGLIIGIRGLSDFFQPRQMRSVKFSLTDDIGGLRVGDEVRAGGFKIGEVKNISIAGVEEQSETAAAEASATAQSAEIAAPSIVITYSIPAKYVVREGARLRVQGTLTGVSWLNFESFGRGRVMPASEALAGLPSAMSQLMADVAEAGPAAKNILADVQATVSQVRNKTVPAVNDMIARYQHAADSFAAVGDDVRQQVHPAFEKYQTVMDTLRDKGAKMMDNVSDFFGSTTPDFRVTLANLNKITTDINAKLPGMIDRLNAMLARVDTSLKSASTAIEDIKTAAANTKDITSSARDLIVGNRGKLTAMIASLKETGDNLKAATAEIRRSPWRLLYKPAPNEMANLNLFDAARAFSDGASNLNDAATALRDAIQSKDVSKADLQKLLDRVDQSFAQFQAVEQKLWRQVKD